MFDCLQYKHSKLLAPPGIIQDYKNLRGSYTLDNFIIAANLGEKYQVAIADMF